ncbi:MAG TPA: hypothetical protein VK897_22625 [Anaerolineales bacterium]|nr:hypothetical protein [Anaerolineales bacterium]
MEKWFSISYLPRSPTTQFWLWGNIQDPMLFAETTTIEVTVDSQSPVAAATNGESSVILVSAALANGWQSVTLYDTAGEVLYTQGG